MLKFFFFSIHFFLILQLGDTHLQQGLQLIFPSFIFGHQKTPSSDLPQAKKSKKHKKKAPAKIVEAIDVSLSSGEEMNQMLSKESYGKHVAIETDLSRLDGELFLSAEVQISIQ